MSLNADTSALAAGGADTRHGVKVILRTADQYSLWKVRVSAACWSATRIHIFNTTDTECDAASDAFAAGDLKLDWVGRCWLIITSAIHDDLIMKLSHVEDGKLGSLIQEIRSALLVNIAEDVQPLRLELYAATMQACNSDLQSYISFIIQRKEKLSFLEVEIPEEELVHVFLKGLLPLFQPVLLHYAINAVPDTLDKAIEVIRKYASNPTVHAELLKCKSAGMSQNIFAAVSTSSRDKAYCKKFAVNGSCSYGDRCKFVHAANSMPSANESKREVNFVTCAYCKKKGHTELVCRKRLASNANAPTTLIAAVTPAVSSSHVDFVNESSDAYVFVFTVKNNSASVDAVPANDAPSVPTQAILPLPLRLDLVCEAPDPVPASLSLLGPPEVGKLTNSTSSHDAIKSQECVPLIETTRSRELVLMPTPLNAYCVAPRCAEPPPPAPEGLLVALAMKSRSAGWVVDSGATACATYSKDDCINVRPCDISVTAAGCVFNVSLVGTAVVRAIDVLGKVRIINITNCLISDRFPYKLLPRA